MFILVISLIPSIVSFVLIALLGWVQSPWLILKRLLPGIFALACFLLGDPWGERSECIGEILQIVQVDRKKMLLSILEFRSQGEGEDISAFAKLFVKSEFLVVTFLLKRYEQNNKVVNELWIHFWATSPALNINIQHFLVVLLEYVNCHLWLLSFTFLWFLVRINIFPATFVY